MNSVRLVKVRKVLKDTLRTRTYVRARTELPVRRSVALFQSFHGRNISCYPFYLMRELAKRGTHQIYVATGDPVGAARLLDSYKIDSNPVEIGSEMYDQLLATAGLLVNNSTFPQHFIKRPEQIYLNTWHGTPLKTLGIAMPKGFIDLPNVQRNFLKSDFLYFSNEHTRLCMTRDYMIDGIHGAHELVMGSPRTEVLFDGARRSELRAQLGIQNQRVCLYMPTWRGGSARTLETESYEEVLREHLAALAEQLDENVIVLVQLHSLVSGKIDLHYSGRFRRCPPDLETYDLMTVADVLVTDYSSVMFDFAATRREVILFPYDLEEYLAERGLYFPYSDLPFTSVKSPEALAGQLNGTKDYVLPPSVGAFISQFAPMDGPGAAARVLDEVLVAQPQSPPVSPVDLHFVPAPASRRTQKLFVNLLERNNNRSDVVLAFPFERHTKKIEAFLWGLQQKHKLQAKVIPMTGRMQLTSKQAASYAFERVTGYVTTPLLDAARLEARRLFGNLSIRSVECHLQSRKFQLLAKAISTELQD